MRIGRWILRGSLGILVFAAGALAWVWTDRPDLAASGIPTASSVQNGSRPGSVRVTWLGVSTLLFDDGATKILIDGFFSRPDVLDLLGDRPIEPDLEAIDVALATWGIDEVAAIVPVHSHFDHALDTGEVARRTGAIVVGSLSTANAARGAGIGEEQILELSEGGSRQFGLFTLTLIPSRHAPVGAEGAAPYPGRIETPLVPPAPVSAWKEGVSFSVVLAHPQGVALVQGSAGAVTGALDGTRVDVILLGIGGLAGLGEEYSDRYWREIVETTGAHRVFPVHWDDFTREFGDIKPFPRLFDDSAASLGWLSERASRGDPIDLAFLPFGAPVALYSGRSPK
jgi:L-ascorbate metabolism protein UlaG (beta-lactamase superfamily)